MPRMGGYVPTDHASRHEDGGRDEVSIASLSGTPAALATHAALTKTHGCTTDILETSDLTTHTADVDAHHEAMPTNHKAKASEADAQAITKATWTLVTLGDEDYDPGSHFANSRYTVAKAGYYLVCGCGSIVNLADAKIFIVAIYKNGVGVAFARFSASVSTDVYLPISTMLNLAVDDYIELYVYHNDAVDRNTAALATVNWLAVHLLST